MKKEFSLFLIIFLISFLVLPKIIFAEEINLSNNNIMKLFPALQNGVMEQWINSTGSGAFDEPEKQAAFYLIRGAIQKKQLNYILVDLPKEGIIKLYNLGLFLIGRPDTGAILGEIEKQTVNQAVNIAKEWFLQNQTKVATGTLNYSFESHNGNQQNPTFYYNLVYKPRTNNYIDLAIEFYSPENIEPKNSVSNAVGLNTWCWDFPDWQRKCDKYIKPFIFKIKGRIHREQGDFYTWKETLSSEITFPESVPTIEVAKQPTFLDQIKEGLTKKFVEDVLHIPYNIFTIVQDKIIDFINTILKQNTSPQTAEIAEAIESAINQDIITQEKIIEIAQTKITEKETSGQQATESKISLEEAQEILDDIAEKIDILTQQTEELTGAKIITDKKDLVVEEEIGKLDQEEEIEEKEEIEEVEELQEEEKVLVPSIAICQKIAGYYPVHNSIILNEIAWMGTTTSSNNEWIELKNISNNPVDLTGWQLLDKDQNIKIVFTDSTDRGRASISAKGFYLLERTNDDAVPGISADFIYTGSLNNSNEALYLFDPSCQLQDEIEVFSNWPFGDNFSKRTIERKNNFEWQSSNNIGGTPKMENSNGYYTYQGSSSSGSSNSDIENPIANAGLDQIVTINEPITFNASGSSDNIKITSCKWDINQDGQWDLEGEKVTYRLGYPITGEYLITLQVADKAGNIATDTLTATIIESPQILISEIQTAGKNEQGKQVIEDEFIELYNPNDKTINLTNWTLKKKNAGSNESSLVSSAKFSGSIAAKDYFLIFPQSKNSPDDSYINYSGKSYSISSNNTILLYDSYNNLMDKVGFGQAQDFENSPTENPQPGRTIGRKWNEGIQNYQDTDNNQQDFEIQISTPGNQNRTFNDIIPPETTIDSHPLGLTNQTQATFTFSSNEEDFTFECKIDAENWQTCSSPQQYLDLVNSLHVFQVRAKDINQNLDSTPAQYQWEIDINPLQVEILIGSPPLTNQTRATFTFQANKQNCSFECKLDDENWQSCQSPKEYKELLNGQHNFSVKAKDLFLNESLPIEYTWTIDTLIESPTFSLFDLNTNSQFYTNQNNVGVIISISEDDVEWFLSENNEKPTAENSAWQTEKPEILTLSQIDGPKTVFIWTKDNAENISQLGNSASIILDTQVPEISLTAKPTNRINQTQATFTFSSNENSTFQCQLNDFDWQENCLSPLTFSDLIEGQYNFQIKALDLADNFSESLIYFWTIDLTPPDVSFNEISSPQAQTSFLISWTGEGEFQLRYSDDEINWNYFPSENEYTSDTQYNFTGEDETAYHFQIKAKDEAGNESQWSPQPPILIETNLPKPILSIEIEKIEFEGIEFGDKPNPKTFTISNTGSSLLEWEIIILPEVGWLSLNSISGQLPSQESENISISINISDLSSGQYFTELFINSDNGSKNIEIILKLAEDIIPPSNANLILADIDNDSNFYTNDPVIRTVITDDQEASFWLLSEKEDGINEEEIAWETERPIEFILSEENGKKTVYLWTKDKAGNISQLGNSFSIILDTSLPIANAGPDQTVIINQSITLDASDSNDNFEIILYQWDINNDGEFDFEGQKPILNDGYSQSGEYLITLKVSDSAENTTTDTLIITAIPQPKILISEIKISEKTGDKNVFVELYSPNDFGVNLTGWYIFRNDSSFITKTLLEGKKIHQKDYFLITRKGSIWENQTDVLFDDKTLNENDKIVLKNPEGEIVDEVSWSQIPSGFSLGRKWNEDIQNYQDTNNNQQDFEIQIPTPGSQNQSLPKDTTPPEISNIHVLDITETSALINWETNEESTSMIEYGITADYGETTNNDDYLLSHSLSLTDLESGTTYRYKVGSTDEKENAIWSEDNTFTTLSRTELLPLFEDDFDSYNLANPSEDISGDLAGQGGWTTTGNNSYEVVDTYAHSGTKSIRCKSYYPCYVAKTGTNETTGALTIRFYIVAHNNFRNWDTTFYFRQNLEEPILGYVSLKDIGPPFDFTIWLGSTNQIYTNISPDQWHTLKVEWDADINKMRIQLDDLEPSDWIEGGIVNYISTFEISNSGNAGRWVYIDTIE